MNTEGLLDIRMIQRRAKSLAARLGESDFIIRSRSMEDGSPHIEVTDTYYYVVCERGLELSRKRATDLDELLYWILQDLAWTKSWDFEVRHRRAGEDSRRQAFEKQVELLGSLSGEWAARQRRELAETLRLHPFHDA